MQSLYIAANETIIRDRKHRYTHPTTGEVYGGTDYDDPAKLAEIGAVPLRDQGPAEGKVADGWEIVAEADGFVRRPLEEVDPPAPVEAPVLDQLSMTDHEILSSPAMARMLEDIYEERKAAGKTVGPDAQVHINKRKALRARL